ncbi:HAD family hydrolase [Myroides injenensis]|uniref:hypothetical protein n=1 Tax=Myroides injenensis TaxID=1183151 RepID=UPI000289FFC9|nr:hypothetical protein [Myroides injenensis]
MKISFDLDDTLISNSRFPLEKETLMTRIFGVERLRLGTLELLKTLRDRGYEVCVYTTSYRSKTKIKRMFWAYGFSVGTVVNQQLHESRLGSKAKRISKYPPEFGIDIHIDDSLGVQREGKQYGFNTIIVSIEDTDWVNTVLETIDSMNK